MAARNARTPAARGAFALLGIMLAATLVGTSAYADRSVPQVTVPPATGALSSGSATLERRAADLRKVVLDTSSVYEAARAQAAVLSAASATADAAAEQTMQEAARLHLAVSSRSAVPGIGALLNKFRDGDAELDQAVVAAQAQTEALKTKEAAALASDEAAKVAAAAKLDWTEATTNASQMDLRVEAKTDADASLQLAGFHASNQAGGAQDDRNEAALRTWRGYISMLADALVIPPTAAEMADPAALPAPLMPVLDSAGEPIRGVAQVWRIGASPLVVLPAETIRAVSTAFNRVGDPGADDAAGPDAYACGGFTRDVWSISGYTLPDTSVAQFEQLAVVSRSYLQMGDLIYFGAPAPGVHRSGVYLGGGLWLGAHPDTGAVSVETLEGKTLYGIRRVTWPRPGVLTAAPKPLAGSTPAGCGVVIPPKPVVPPPVLVADPVLTAAPLVATGGISGPTQTTGGGWTMPIAAGAYSLSVGFGARGTLWSGGVHTGQDFAAPIGTPVRAARAGVVTIEHPAWAGNLVRIDHGNGLESWYGHLSVVGVTTGQQVAAGAIVGAVGSEGNSTGPHLHFEIRVDGLPVDPMPLLNSSSAAGWGGYANGEIPSSALCGTGVGSLLLRCDAAVAFRLMDQAFTNKFGKRLCMSDGYRSLIDQGRLFLAKPGLAAVPGTSNHGWGLAADLCGGVESFGTPEHTWLAANAPSFGWRHPDWARQGGSRPEPWHFEFGQLS